MTKEEARDFMAFEMTQICVRECQSHRGAWSECDFCKTAEAHDKAVEALENTPQVDNNGLLVVRVDSVEELDKVNEVLVRVKDEAWGKIFAEEDYGDD